MCDSKILVKLDRARVSNDENYKALLAKFDSCEDSFGNSEWYLCSSISSAKLYEIFFWGDVVCKIFYQRCERRCPKKLYSIPVPYYITYYFFHFTPSYPRPTTKKQPEYIQKKKKPIVNWKHKPSIIKKRKQILFFLQSSFLSIYLNLLLLLR